ncbi:MAG TPA: PAS domain S-box protein [Longimicrobiaceae bacterium]|nr:PAS domain S-box protein [Longimicrobiaceae bacterium]
MLLTSDIPNPAAFARELLDVVHEPVLVLDAELRILAASAAFFLEFGVSEDEALGCSIFSVGGGAWTPPELRHLLTDLAPGRSAVESHPLRLRVADGGLCAFTANVRPVRAGVNRIEFFLLSLFRRKEALSPRRPADDSLLRLLAEHATDVAVVYARDGSCLHASAATDSVLGYAPGEWAVVDPFEMIHPADRGEVRARLGQLSAAGAGRRITFRVRRRSGEYIWLESAFRRVSHATHGELLLVSARDVTERQRSEDAVRWLSRQTRLILDSAGEGLFGIDSRGGVTFINPAAGRLLGYPVAELMGRPHDVFTAGSAAAELGATLRDGLPRRSSDSGFLRRDGQMILVEYSCTPARQHGEVVGAVVTFRDVTERRRAEAALRRSEWLAGVGETVLGLRHEINNPLTTLLAGASILEMGGNSPEEEHEIVAAIADQARRIGEVVRRLTERQEDPPIRLDGEQRMLDLTG